MALTGLQVYKLLPKTNCKECGYPTCLAFAMKLAAKQAELVDCPYVSDEGKSQLESASAPPVRLVTMRRNGHQVAAGNETVLFRHEKTFYHAPGLFVRVTDQQSLDDVRRISAQVAAYNVEYVGIDLAFDGIAVECRSGDPDTFKMYVAEVADMTDQALILIAPDVAALAAGAAAVPDVTPLLYATDPEDWSAVAELAKSINAPMVARTDAGLSELAQLTQELQRAGVEDLVLDTGERDYAGSLASMTQIRRLSLKQTFRPLGYPIITFPGEIGGNGASGKREVADEAALAAQHIVKYAGFIVLDDFSPDLAYSLLVLRQNIFTDPQKPIQVQPGLYELNDPTPDSPIMVTTNFSITYFSVANEVESSRTPGWLLVADAEGMSVLTAWAAGKFDATTIAKAVNSTDAAAKLNHRKLIIPGQVAVLSGELEDELPGWEIQVGPREAVDLPAYLKLGV